MDSLQAITERLTGPGAPFELVWEDVLGERMQVVKGRPRSLRELLEQSRQHADKEYLVYGDRRIGYAEHAARVASVARGLQDRFGVGPGDRVAILAANCPEWILTFWATVSLGGVAAALNGWWAGDEVVYAIEHSQPTLLVGDRRRLARVEGRDLGVPVVEIESDFASLERHAPDAALPTHPIAEDDPAVILYTSGTTGRPKGAVNSHRGICGFVSVALINGVRMMIYASQRAQPGQSSQQSGTPPAPAPPCALVTAPLFHLSGLYSGAVMMLATGAKTVWRSGRFDPEDVLRLIERERVTTWSALGTMAHQVVTHPDVGRYDLSSVQNIGSGGAPTSREIQEKIRKVFPRGGANMGIGYGLSESVTPAAVITGEELREHPDSVGRAVPSTEIEIRDEQGRALPEGSEGEIHIRSPYLMLEYWRDPKATAETLLPGRWLRTGDIGRLEDGRLYVNSRARDMILRAAENISPVEIEQRLEAHPGVAEAAVLGVDHPELGQEVKAVVVPMPGQRLDAVDLARWVAETLAPYKVPSQWELRDEPLPRNAAGKVLKPVLAGATSNPFVEE